MPRDFRYALITDRGLQCVEAVRAFDQSGKRLLKERFPASTDLDA